MTDDAKDKSDCIAFEIGGENILSIYKDHFVFLGQKSNSNDALYFGLLMFIRRSRFTKDKVAAAMIRALTSLEDSEIEVLIEIMTRLLNGDKFDEKDGDSFAKSIIPAAEDLMHFLTEDE